MERFNIHLVLSYVRYSIAFITHPLIDICPMTIFTDPYFRQNATKFTTRIFFRASEFDLYIILLRFYGFEAPLLEFLLGKKSKFLFFFIARARLWSIDAEQTDALLGADIKTEIYGNIYRVSIDDLF